MPDAIRRTARAAAARIPKLGQRSKLGSRAQVGALSAALADVQGNNDGIAGNEKLRRNQVKGGKLRHNPLVNRIKTAFQTGASTSDEERRINAFVAGREKRWGTPATHLRPGQIDNFENFRAEKTLALARFNRTPSQVIDGFVPARGSVDGKRIADRDVFIQRWKPTAPPTGKVVVVSPGFQETGRNFYEQIDLLNRQGHEVVVMDHQWAGRSRGAKAGGLDRGYGVARDVAAVAAEAASLAQREYGAKGEVVLLGNSMGAGPGVLGALTLNDAGKIQLQGKQMPKGLNAILQAPFLEATPNALNKLFAATSRVPLIKDAALPSLGVPVLTRDPVAAAKFAQHAAREKISARPQAMTAAVADMKAIQAMIRRGEGPKGRIYIVHGDQDPLASPKAAREMARRLGSSAHLNMISSGNHIFEESPSEQRHILDGMAWLGRAR